MRDLWNELCACLERGETVAIATIANDDGSTPRSAGSKMLVGGKGILYGTVGGGLGEAMTVEAAGNVLAQGEPRLFSIDMTGDMAAGADLICGGRLHIFVQRAEPEHAPFYRQLRKRLEAGHATLLVHPAAGRSRPSGLLAEGGGMGEPLDAGLEARVLEDAPSAAELIEWEGGDYFVESIRPPTHLVLAGGGHVSQATARMAALTDFQVTVLDDRAEFASPARFPWLEPERIVAVPGFADCLSPAALGFPADERCFVAILTRGHANDYDVLTQALRTKAGYIGMIGSSRKRAGIFEKLSRDGFGQTDIDRIHTPIGLAIKAETPAEIAVSILAELIAVRAGLQSRQR